MIALTLYSRPGCHLCEEMSALVAQVVRTTADPVHIAHVDISTDPELEARYGLEIPVLLMNGRKVAKYRIAEEALRRMLVLAGQRAEG